MSARDEQTRSLSCVELIGLLDEACDALIELDIALADEEGLARVRRAMRLNRSMALRMIAERCRQIEALARSCCCVADVPYLEAVLRVDGERVSVTRFPEVALRAVAPLYECLMDDLREERGDLTAGADVDTVPFPFFA